MEDIVWLGPFVSVDLLNFHDDFKYYYFFMLFYFSKKMIKKILEINKIVLFWLKIFDNNRNYYHTWLLGWIFKKFKDE